MKKKVLVITVLALMAAAPAFAADGDQGGSNWAGDMYKYCQQTMQQWGDGSGQSQGMPMGQPQAGGMMGQMMMRQ